MIDGWMEVYILFTHVGVLDFMFSVVYKYKDTTEPKKLLREQIN